MEIVIKGYSPAADQKDCNSCLAISTCQAFSDKLRAFGVISVYDQLDYIEFLDTIDVRKDICDRGISLTNGLRFMTTVGARSSLTGKRHRTRGWSQVVSLEQVKKNIDHSIAMVATMPFFNNFEGFRGKGLYHPDYVMTKSLIHMVSIIGYVKGTDILIIRNSYGRLFGDNGLFRMRYSYLNDVYAPL